MQLEFFSPFDGKIGAGEEPERNNQVQQVHRPERRIGYLDVIHNRLRHGRCRRGMKVEKQAGDHRSQGENKAAEKKKTRRAFPFHFYFHRDAQHIIEGNEQAVIPVGIQRGQPR